MTKSIKKIWVTPTALVSGDEYQIKNIIILISKAMNAEINKCERKNFRRFDIYSNILKKLNKIAIILTHLTTKVSSLSSQFRPVSSCHINYTKSKIGYKILCFTTIPLLSH